jgi:hypothetical protein
MKSFIEAVSFNDSLAKKQTGKRLIESVTHSDSINILKTIGKYFIETATYTDVVAKLKVIHKTITESSTYTDVITKVFHMGRILVEAIGWTDILYGKLNGVNMKYFKKYANKVGTYIKKYFDI